MSNCRNWCFTVNNYTEDDIRKAKNLPCKYIIFGKEVGESGTPHLQGYVQLAKRTRLTGVKKLINNQVHWEPAKGTPQQNIEYCSKQDQQAYRNGVVSVERERKDLDAFMSAVRDEGVLNKKRLREEYPEVMARYPRFADEYIQDNTPTPEMMTHPLNQWQGELNLVLNREPDPRKIIFIVDEKGGAGKTSFASDFYCQMHDNAQYLTCGKKSDMAHALRTDCRVIFINCSKTQTENLNYELLEQIKDGCVFSGKYNSCMKRFKRPHVVVLMNQMPDMNALVADRYQIIEVSK